MVLTPAALVILDIWELKLEMQTGGPCPRSTKSKMEWAQQSVLISSPDNSDAC